MAELERTLVLAFLLLLLLLLLPIPPPPPPPLSITKTPSDIIHRETSPKLYLPVHMPRLLVTWKS
jgi:hypothetical protein